MRCCDLVQAERWSKQQHQGHSDQSVIGEFNCAVTVEKGIGGPSVLKQMPVHCDCGSFIWPRAEGIVIAKVADLKIQASPDLVSAW